jgi:hypothetical protein
MKLTHRLKIRALFMLPLLTLSGSSTSEDVPDFYSLPACNVPAINWTVLCACGYQQTTGYTCGPSSAISLLRYQNLITPSEANHTLEMRIARDMGTNSQNGTSSAQLAAFLTSLDTQNGTRVFDVASGYNATLDLLRDQLSKKVPVLIDWIDWGGHWVMAIGYLTSPLGPEFDSVYFADPAMHYRMPAASNPCGITGMNAQRFQSMWFDSTGQKGVHVIARMRG